jgi:flagellin-like hook-associated protein FlgL
MATAPITLTSGMRANLVSLQKTNDLMELTQKRLSSGKKVNSALDDPVSYFTAVAHEQRAGDLASRKDEMAESIQLIKAADSGIESIRSLISAAKSLATSALSGETTSDINTLMSQYHQVMSQIDDIAEDSGYKGVNLLDSSNITHQVKFDELGSSSLSITGFDAEATGATLTLMSFTTANAWISTGGTADKAEINSAITRLDSATRSLRTESSKLANNLSIITARQDFTQGMINVLKDGAGGLTNADMNEEGANMLMLQTRQSLGTTSLSLASQAAQAVLRLF